MILKLKNEYKNGLPVEMFYLILEACCNHGDFKMTEYVYFTMEKQLKVKTDARCQLKYLTHQKKERRLNNIKRVNTSMHLTEVTHKKPDKMEKLIKEEQYLQPESIFYKRMCDQ